MHHGLHIDAIKHAHDKASARGWASATDKTPNRYAHGTQCAILFDLAKEKAIRAEEAQKTHDHNPNKK